MLVGVNGAGTMPAPTDEGLLDAFRTVTRRAVEMEAPRPSYAVARSVCAPLRVLRLFQAHVQTLLRLPPSRAARSLRPSTLKLT